MEHNTQRTPDRNGQHIDNVSGVPVAVLNNTGYENITHRRNVEIYCCSCRPVDNCTHREHIKPLGAEWGRISATIARHQGKGGTMARPFPFMADTQPTPKTKNRKPTVRRQAVGNPSGTSRTLTRKQPNVRNF